MQRFQLSIRKEQAEYLASRAMREGVSRAEVVRRLLDVEARCDSPEGSGTILDIVGLFKDELPLIDGIPVSEDPDLYLYGRGSDSAAAGYGPSADTP